MRLVLHIGFSEAGAREVQDFLYRNRSPLASKGVLVPRTGMYSARRGIRSDPASGHDAFAAVFGLERLESRGAYFRSSMLTELLSSSADVAVISSARLGDPKLGADPAKVQSVFGSVAEVVPMVYLSRQDHLVDRKYREALVSDDDQESPGLVRYARAVLGQRYLDFVARLQPWIDVFGAERLIVRSYDDAVSGEGVVHDFARQLGVLDLSDLETVPRCSERLIGRTVVNLVRAINELASATSPVRSEAVDTLLSDPQWSDPINERATSLVPHGLWTELAGQYRADNQVLADGLMSGPTAKFLFPKHRTKVRTTKARWSIDQARSAVLGLWPDLAAPTVDEKPHVRAATSMAALKPHARTSSGVGLTSLIKAPLPEILNWVYYHFNIGIDRIVLFVDGPEFFPELNTIDRLTTINCDADFWHNVRVYNPINIVQKQQPLRKLGQRALVADGMKWIVNVDGDELLYGDICEDLRTMDDAIDLVRFRPLEAIQHDHLSDVAGFASRVFKLPHALASKSTDTREGTIAESHFTRFGFFGHTEGKSAARSRVVADFWGCHTLANTKKRLVEVISTSTVLLHFDNHPFDQWRRRWQWKLAQPREVFLVDGGPRGRQMEHLAELFARDDEDQLRRLHDSWYRVDSIKLERLVRDGIIT